MRGIKSKLKRKLKAGQVEELCGLILKSGKVISIPNAHPEKEKAFAIPVKAMDENLDQLHGTWHTHPGSDSHLSQDDYFGFAQWPGLIHHIVGTDGVRAYVADETGIVKELPCR